MRYKQQVLILTVIRQSNAKRSIRCAKDRKLHSNVILNLTVLCDTIWFVNTNSHCETQWISSVPYETRRGPRQETWHIIRLWANVLLTPSTGSPPNASIRANPNWPNSPLHIEILHPWPSFAFPCDKRWFQIPLLNLKRHWSLTPKPFQPMNDYHQGKCEPSSFAWLQLRTFLFEWKHKRTNLMKSMSSPPLSVDDGHHHHCSNSVHPNSNRKPCECEQQQASGKKW